MCVMEMARRVPLGTTGCSAVLLWQRAPLAHQNLCQVPARMLTYFGAVLQTSAAPG